MLLGLFVKFGYACNKAIITRTFHSIWLSYTTCALASLIFFVYV